MKVLNNINKWRVLFAAFLLICAVSCEKHIEIRRTGPERELSLNVALTAGPSEQVAYVTTSYHNKVRGVKDALLKLYVNDELAASSDTLREAHNYHDNNSDAVMMIPFHARFGAGDKVRLEVTADGMRASAESIAPESAKIVSVDTIPITKISGDRTTALTRIKVQVQDVSGIDNYYRIEAFVKYSISQVYLDPGEFDPVGPQFLRKCTISVKLDNKAEPILYSGSHVDAYYDPEDTDYYANEYNLFNDNVFRDKDYTLTLYAKDLRQYFSFTNIAFLPNLRVSEKRTLVVRLYTMNKDMYTYYNDCMFDNSLQGMSDFIPLIPYPDNVNGGNGFVGALSVNDFEMELPYIEDVYNHYHNL